MKQLICTVTVVMIISTTGVWAQSPEERGAIRNPDARGALIRHERAVEQARQEYLRKLMDLDRALIRDLETALAAVTRAGNLDEAIRIRTAKDEAEQQLTQRQAELTGRAVTPSRDLAQSLIEQRMFTHYRVPPSEKRTFLLERDGTIGGEAGSWSRRWAVQTRDGEQVLVISGQRGDYVLRRLESGIFLGHFRGIPDYVLLVPQ